MPCSPSATKIAINIVQKFTHFDTINVITLSEHLLNPLQPIRAFRI